MSPPQKDRQQQVVKAEGEDPLMEIQDYPHSHNILGRPDDLSRLSPMETSEADMIKLKHFDEVD